MIKTTVVDTPFRTIDFPKLMVTRKGLIVLFSTDVKGTVIVGDGYHTIGNWSDHWVSQDFIDYEGTLTLTNEE